MSRGGQKYIDEIAGIGPGKWLTYGDVAKHVGTPAGARAAGQAVLHLGDRPEAPAVPSWRVFRQGGKLPEIHGAEWGELFERKWTEEDLVENFRGGRRAKPGRHASSPRRNGGA